MQLQLCLTGKESQVVRQSYTRAVSQHLDSGLSLDFSDILVEFSHDLVSQKQWCKSYHGDLFCEAGLVLARLRAGLGLPVCVKANTYWRLLTRVKRQQSSAMPTAGFRTWRHVLVLIRLIQIKLIYIL